MTMNREEVLRLAEQADCMHVDLYGDRAKGLERLERFAALLSHAAPTCKTCDGHGLVGGMVAYEGGVDSICEPCPDCASSPAHPQQSASQQALSDEQLDKLIDEHEPGGTSGPYVDPADVRLAMRELCRALLSHTAPQAEPASAPAVSERAFDKLTGAFYREHQRLPSLPEIFAFAHRAGAAEALARPEPAKTQKCVVCGSGVIDGGKIEETAAPAQDGWHEVDRLLKTVKYLIGIAERGDGRAMRDDETTEQFVLGYVKRLESKLSTARAAGFEQCKEMAAKACEARIGTGEPGIEAPECDQEARDCATAIRALQCPERPAAQSADKDADKIAEGYTFNRMKGCGIDYDGQYYIDYRYTKPRTALAQQAGKEAKL